MQRSFGSLLKVVGLAFALVVGVHFAAPPSASASCFCSGPLHSTPTFQAVSDSCDSDTAWLNEDFVNAEGDVCGGYDSCSQHTVITTACFQRTDGQWETDAYQRFDCQSGTTCP
jgi:hypothetical protein